MNQSRQFRNYFLSWKNCFESMKKGRIISLFLLYAVIQIVFIFMLMFYAYPPFSAFLIPVMKRLFGEAVTHYPNNFLVMPTMFFWLNLLLSGFVGIVLVGATTDLFSRSFLQKRITIGTGLRSIMPQYLVLFAVWLLETLALLAVFFGIPMLLKNIEFFTNRGPLTTQLATSLVAIVVGALFVYTTALIVLEKRGPFGAIGKSLSLFARYPIITILLIAVPNFIRMPVDLLSGKTQFLLTKFNPESVAFLLIFSTIVSVFANYFLVGTVTRYFLLSKGK